jgi:predicted alpha-1,6-mannanase (GH76 family)
MVLMLASAVSVLFPPKRLRAAALLPLLVMLVIIAAHCGFVITVNIDMIPDGPMANWKHGSTQLVAAEYELELPPRRTRSDTARRLELELKIVEALQAVEHMTLTTKFTTGSVQVDGTLFSD